MASVHNVKSLSSELSARLLEKPRKRSRALLSSFCSWSCSSHCPWLSPTSELWWWCWWWQWWSWSWSWWLLWWLTCRQQTTWKCQNNFFFSSRQWTPTVSCYLRYPACFYCSDKYLFQKCNCVKLWHWPLLILFSWGQRSAQGFWHLVAGCCWHLFFPLEHVVSNNCSLSTDPLDCGELHLPVGYRTGV